MSAPPPAAAPAAGAADVKAFAQRLGLDWDVSLAEDGSRQPLLVAEDDEELSSSYSGVELAIGDSGSSAGTGTVFVTTRCVVRVARCWQGAGLPGTALLLQRLQSKSWCPTHEQQQLAEWTGCGSGHASLCVDGRPRAC